MGASGVTWKQNARFMGAKAASFDASSSAAALVPKFDPLGISDGTGPFSVAAWVRLGSTTCAGVQTAVSVDMDADPAKNHSSAFALGYDCTKKKWLMRIAERNAADTPVHDVTAGAPVAGKWTHLVGEWSTDLTLRLYVDGTLAGELPAVPEWFTFDGFTWTPGGAVTFGRARRADKDVDHLVGELADVRLWNRVLTGDDLHGTTADSARGVPTQPGILSARPVGSWDFNVDLNCGCASSAGDTTAWNRPLFLDSGWHAPTPTSWFAAGGHDDNAAVAFDGVAGYASTTNPADAQVRPVLRTDASYTVSAWVHLDTVDRTQVAVSQDGQNTSAFRLGFNKGNNSWCLVVRKSDAVNTASDQACGKAPDLDKPWQHLVGVYDAVANQARLYVDGELAGSVTLTSPAWQAAGAFQIGRGLTTATGGARTVDAFDGQIDQVNTWQGALTADQIAALFNA
jgi:hypothetical protein